ncbi:MAG TPA: cytochrome b [Coxiellaceae bacterium]|nr:cytochrome b [Coxiellaceae bacterium]
MGMCNTRESYGLITKLFHWSIAIVVILMLSLGPFMEDIPSDSIKTAAYTLHKSLGLTIFVLALCAFVWHWINPQPEDPSTMPCWQHGLAKLVHLALYVLLMAMPISGLLMSVYAGHPPHYFWLFTVNLPLEKSEALAKQWNEYHQYIAWTLAILGSLHVLAALAHHFWYKDNILRRMMLRCCRKDK